MAQIFLGKNLKSLAVELMAKYTRAVDAELVKITKITPEEQKVLNILSVPCMIVSDAEKTFKCSSTYAIFRHIAELTRFEKIFMGRNEADNSKILSYFELINSLETAQLGELLNNDLKMRVFLATYNITAADIYAYAHIVGHAKSMTDLEKIDQNNLFRWVDHIQNLPGINKFSVENGLEISFPDENTKKPSKRELKKLAKQQYKKDQKAWKTEEKKDGKKQQKQQLKNNEEEKKEGDATKETTVEVPKQKKEKKQKQQNQNKGKKKGEVDYSAEPITLVDVRIGQITKVWKHPESEKLYCEEVDIGEEKVRTIASGLQSYIPIEKMENAMVCVAANLKARKLAGFLSHGMVLCAETPDKSAVELLTPPEGSKVGDIVTFSGYERNAPPQLNPKKKIFEAVQPDFKIDAKGVAMYKDAEWVTEKGKCTAASIKNGIIA